MGEAGMKCVQVVGQGVPVRITDEEAFQWVERDHDGQYCPKSVWKKWYADDRSNGYSGKKA